MRVVWTILSLVGAWVSFNALKLALTAASNPPPNLPYEDRTQYVNVAWVGLVVLVALTTGSIYKAVRSFKKR